VLDNSGAISDLADACRDLSIPCVTATISATTRIATGCLVNVDGSTGTVRPAFAGQEARAQSYLTRAPA
jgi:phosphoenolpyruvate-protein kinase (PTS system EI component)